jgi:bla regulator protein blaR1
MVSDFFLNHLWQSTLFAAAAALLTLLFRKNHARVRYALWLAGSIKFLVPFSLFIAIGSSIDFGRQRAASIAQPAVAIVEGFSQPFGSANLATQIPAVVKPDRFHLLWMVVSAMWVCGCLAVLVVYLAKSWRMREVVRKAELIKQGRAFEALQQLEQIHGRRFLIKIIFSSSSMEPGVFGIFRPVLLLPLGMTERLNDSELEAIVAHELSHVRRHDNLVAAIHMFIEALFWFHPMVWWLGAKLVQERERACDEEVLRLGKDPQAYAEGILKICEFYLESPLACVAGITGSDMKKRIHAIMTQHIGSRLSLLKKFLLAGAGFTALALPFAIGLVNATSGRAQPQDSPKPSFDAASIKPYVFDGRVGINTQPGRFVASGVTLKFLISMAYDIKKYQISGAQSWLDTVTYGIEAKAPIQMTRESMILMLQSLIEERCKLKFHRETREGPVYSLVVAKGGHKLERSKDEKGNPLTEVPHEGSKGRIILGPGSRAPAGTVFYSGNGLSAGAISIVNLASFLSDPLGRKIIDKTGISGLYDINIQWAPDPGQPDLTGMPKPPGFQPPPAENTAPSIFIAIQEQLGLKLEPDKGPVDFFIIDSVEKPSEN